MIFMTLTLFTFYCYKKEPRRLLNGFLFNIFLLNAFLFSRISILQVIAFYFYSFLFSFRFLDYLLSFLASTF